jgi:hypothetical protein
MTMKASDVPGNLIDGRAAQAALLDGSYLTEQDHASKEREPGGRNIQRTPLAFRPIFGYGSAATKSRPQ